ncbi:MAG: PEP/pyruvate-binding domain-containing protein [Gordonia sp. (in: high G+C Gram-positive bacteria)]|uniref:PEP/pyruvate-binding domain-containing protein n=1 Tax=Gordonia sp. (in: high G+C Gram-positive bacteria) TaxID=84139 RepID=UPI0039E406D5
MSTTLRAATVARCGGKAAALGDLLRAGLPVPDGFVVTDDDGSGERLRAVIARGLRGLGDVPVAVRSSAAHEDADGVSAAGQYESLLGVRGVDDVCAAVTECRDSARTGRVRTYLGRMAGAGVEPGDMAVLVQPVVPAEVSGVLFTPQHAAEPVRIESSWGLGISVVGGTVTPDSYEVAAAGTVVCAPGSKRTRIDLAPGGVVASEVPAADRDVPSLNDEQAVRLARLGRRIADLRGGPQDVEWAVVDDAVWVLQARPVTAPPPHPDTAAARCGTPQVLTGTPGSPGQVTGPARLVRGPADFSAVRRGEIVVCPYTDPAWTPLFAFAAGVVTQTGGALSHAAIVAREYGIPAVLGVAGALDRIPNGGRVHLDCAAGTVAPAENRPAAG